MAANTDVLLLLLREIYVSAAYREVSPTDIIPFDAPLLAAIHAAGVKTTAAPTFGELRLVIKNALETAGHVELPQLNWTSCG